MPMHLFFVLIVSATTMWGVCRAAFGTRVSSSFLVKKNALLPNLTGNAMRPTVVTVPSFQYHRTSLWMRGMDFDLDELYDDDDNDDVDEEALFGAMGGGGGGGGGRRKKKKKSPPKKKKADVVKDDWKVPSTIEIPEDRVDISFSRSGGSGGQNVNKVNTKVELRFKLDDADWLPDEVRDRIREQAPNRINKDGVFNIQSSENRTQQQNRRAAFTKLQEIVLRAYPRPKVRKLRKGISKKAKERNLEDKKRRGQVKANRKSVDLSGY
uniref:Prokaryotic-type class I peptide chain release factors domain-containing protein n=1 Tax=Cyclophora tenuis TaxID=216820 RepID=A0A7S1D533_CYCTE|mmetsp:Transcript_23561/g.39983  ORF Transcript_23561/g.39983 Transcript_23561/m.39983 type:complete len:267 (+) Transcript_23561:60-860(+)